MAAAEEKKQEKLKKREEASLQRKALREAEGGAEPGAPTPDTSDKAGELSLMSRETAFNAGCKAYLTKPCEPHVLWAQIRVLLKLPQTTPPAFN